MGEGTRRAFSDAEALALSFNLVRFAIAPELDVRPPTEQRGAAAATRVISDLGART